MEFDPKAILQIAEIGASLVQLGYSTFQQFMAAIRDAHGTQMTEDEMNQIAAWVQDDSARRDARRRLDAAGQA